MVNSSWGVNSYALECLCDLRNIQTSIFVESRKVALFCNRSVKCLVCIGVLSL